MNYTVLITTSGTGSRLKNLTKTTNKSLVKINGKASINHIIESYPNSTEFVITLGYFGEKVRDHILKEFPKHNITFCEVDKYTGNGSSLGYSMLCAKKYLLRPFIFHACDTLVIQKLPLPKFNWATGYKLDNVDQYRTLETAEGNVVHINNKKEGTSQLVHIGLVGIKDYMDFWNALGTIYEKDKNDSTINDTYVINAMLKKDNKFKLVTVQQWFDIGNPEALVRTKELLK